MVERKSHKKSADKCEICGKEVARSVSRKKAAGIAGLEISSSGGPKVHLCKEHYKVFKKATKTDRKLDSLSWQ